MSISAAALHAVALPAPTPIDAAELGLQSTAAHRSTYRQEQSLSPQRSNWSRSLSRLRGHSRTRLVDASPADASRSRSPLARLVPGHDLREDLPALLSRFLGYRSEDKGPYKPLFAWQDRIPRRFEDLLLSATASFTSIVAIEAIMIKSALFHDWGGVPLITASLGASAVLLFGTFESPLSQPRNAVGGQFLSALASIIINRLFALNSDYKVTSTAPSDGFSQLDWLSAALSMAISLVIMDLTGTIHPPGGATALIVSIEAAAVDLHWRFLLVILASILLMVGFALLFNNVGHRKYPIYWWSPQKPSEPSGMEMQRRKESLHHDSVAEEDETKRRGRPSTPKFSAAPL